MLTLPTQKKKLSLIMRNFFPSHLPVFFILSPPPSHDGSKKLSFSSHSSRKWRNFNFQWAEMGKKRSLWRHWRLKWFHEFAQNQQIRKCNFAHPKKEQKIFSGKGKNIFLLRHKIQLGLPKSKTHTWRRLPHPFYHFGITQKKLFKKCMPADLTKSKTWAVC